VNPERFDGKPYHFFLGDGMVHQVELRAGEATYRRRFVRTPSFCSGGARDELPSEALQGDEPSNERGGLANTAMVFHAGRLLCLEEGSKPWEICLPSLETSGRFTFRGRLRHNFTAHPKVCPLTGELMFFGYGTHHVPGSEAWVHYSVASKEGELLRTVPVNFRKPVMTHDMAITKCYSILLDFPLWDMDSPTKEDDKTRIGVMPRMAESEKDVVWIEAPGQYGYHVANAWEQVPDDSKFSTVVVELVMVSALGFDFRKSNTDSLRLRLFALDVSCGHLLDDRVLCDVPCEFPIVDARRVGLPTRYIWASRLAVGAKEVAAMDGILRYDMRKNVAKQITLPGGRHGGEVQFVPRRYSDRRGKEGDGYLLVLTVAPAAVSELLVFDAETMSEQPVAVVSLPLSVPLGFHALWVDAEAYREHVAAEVWRSKL